MYVHCDDDDDDDDDDDGCGGGGGGGGGRDDGDGDGEVVRTLLDFFFPYEVSDHFVCFRVVDSTRRFRRRCKIFFSAEASPCPMRTRFPCKFSTCNKGLVVDLAQ